MTRGPCQRFSAIAMGRVRSPAVFEKNAGIQAASLDFMTSCMFFVQPTHCSHGDTDCATMAGSPCCRLCHCNTSSTSITPSGVYSACMITKLHDVDTVCEAQLERPGIAGTQLPFGRWWAVYRHPPASQHVFCKRDLQLTFSRIFIIIVS